MRKSHRRGQLGSSNRFWLASILAVILVCMVALWVLSSDARREIDELATANADSSQWSIAQAEVELLTLHNALLSARLTPETGLSEVRQRFDVFYARSQLVRRSRNFEPIRADPGAAEALERLYGYLDRWVPVIDGPDAALADSLDALAADTLDLRDTVREIGLTSVRIFAVQSEAQRANVADALLDLALIALALFLVLSGTVIALSLSLARGKRQNISLSEAQSRLRAMVSTSLDGILVVGRDGRILDFNGAAERIFGYSPAEAIGQRMADLIVPDHLREAHLCGMERYLSSGRKAVIDAGLVQLEATDKTGRLFPVELSLSTAQSYEGEVFVAYIRDISDRVAAQRELVETRDRALAGEKAKAELLAVMSHEMRTPLNGLLGSLDLLAGSNLTEAQRQYVRIMESSGSMLLDHVNTVLDISRVDAGRIALRPEIFDLPMLMRDVADSQALLASARGNRVALSPCARDLTAVHGDKGRLRQVLVNLLANAIKFTRDGNIRLSARRLPGTDLVEIHVSDTGIGIANADRERIFEDFVTLDSSYAREVEGTGLGLGIVRRFVKAMGGEVRVESAPGEGSDFSLLLPLPAVPGGRDIVAAQDTPRRRPLPLPEDSIDLSGPEEGPLVLVVEDNEINRIVAQRMLADLGCRTAAAHDGLEGVELAERDGFDLILTDISMPRLDGLEATRRIRAGSGPNASTPIVALTAHALPTDIARFRQAGITDVVVKPISKQRLAGLLSAVLTGPHRAALPEDMGDEADTPSLEDLLGPEAGRRMQHRAEAEIAEGLAEMLRLAQNGGLMAEIGGIAHKLAGLCAVTGASNLHSEFVTIEMAARDPDAEEDPDDRVALVEILSELRARCAAVADQMDPASTM